MGGSPVPGEGQMSSDLTLFHFDDEKRSFEDLGQPNGATHWREEDLREALGYATEGGLAKAVTKAKQACLSIGMQCEEHLVLQPNGRHLLTRFGCYLVAMNADPKKPEVAAAQAYFAALADTFQTHIDHADGIDRSLIRSEISDGQRSLASTAKQHGVIRYDFFMNQGYMGMYNMSLKQLCRIKGLPDGKKLFDYMGKAEMAANLFRLTQTDEKIKNESIRGQRNLERAAHDVGRTVRQTMMTISGQRPEDLPLAEDITSVRKKLKGTSKRFRELDGPKKATKKKKPPSE